MQNLSPHLIVSTLLDPVNPKANRSAQIYVVGPPNTSIVSSIHTLLCSRLRGLPLEVGESLESVAFDLLERVRILQYLDLPGLAESLSEVSQSLFEHDKVYKTTDDGTGGDLPGHHIPTRSLLLIQGLSATLTTVQRRSGNVQTCAILSNILRTINHLSRIYSDLVALVEVEITTESQVAGEGESEAGCLDTAFSSSTGAPMRVVPEGAVGTVIEQDMDVVLCVHDGFAKATGIAKDKRRNAGQGARTLIVEVVKDTVGATFGEWCIWVQ